MCVLNYTHKDKEDNDNPQRNTVPTKDLEVTAFDVAHQEFNNEERYNISDNHSNDKGNHF